MAEVVEGSCGKRTGKTSKGSSIDKGKREDEDLGLNLSSDTQDFIAALQNIRGKTLKLVKNKSEETMASVSSEVKTILDDVKTKLEKQWSYVKAVSKNFDKCDNSLKDEFAKFQSVYEKFFKEKAAHLQAFEDIFSKFDNEKEKLYLCYEKKMEKEKIMLSEMEKTCADKIKTAEEAIQKFENSLRDEYAKFQSVYENFSQEKAAQAGKELLLLLKWTSSGTFICCINCEIEKAGVAAGDSRTTYNYGEVEENGVMKNYKVVRCRMDENGIFEQRSPKIHCARNFLLAAAGKRLFNRRVVEEISARRRCVAHHRTLRIDQTIDQIAKEVKRTMKDVWRNEFEEHIIRKRSQLNSTFLIQMMTNDTRPIIKKVSMVKDYSDMNKIIDDKVRITDCPKYAFAGGMSKSTRKNIKRLLEGTVGKTLPTVMQIAHECACTSTKAAEESKVGAATVGGWDEIWTLENLRARSKSLESFPDGPDGLSVEEIEQEVYGNSIFTRYKLGRIPESSEVVNMGLRDTRN